MARKARDQDLSPTWSDNSLRQSEIQISDLQNRETTQTAPSSVTTAEGTHKPGKSKVWNKHHSIPRKLEVAERRLRESQPRDSCGEAG